MAGEGPELDGVVVTAAGEDVAAGGKGKGGDSVFVGDDGAGLGHAVEIPKSQRLVGSSADQALPIGGDG